MSMQLDDKQISKIYIGDKKIKSIYLGYHTLFADPISNSPDYLCFAAGENNSTISMSRYGTIDSMPTLEYSFSSDPLGTWLPFDISTDVNSGTAITLENIGDKVYFRGMNSSFSQDFDNYFYFVMTGKIYAGGTIMSLLDADCNLTTINSNYCFTHLFNDCTSLITPPKFTATEMFTSAYTFMFNNCTNLSSPPEFPADLVVYDPESTDGDIFNFSSVKLYFSTLADDEYTIPFIPYTTMVVPNYEKEEGQLGTLERGVTYYVKRNEI